jgi:hypothetical protein
LPGRLGSCVCVVSVLDHLGDHAAGSKLFRARPLARRVFHFFFVKERARSGAHTPLISSHMDVCVSLLCGARIERGESRGATSTDALQYVGYSTLAGTVHGLDIVGIGRTEGNGSGATVPARYSTSVGTVHARERQEARQLGL